MDATLMDPVRGILPSDSTVAGELMKLQNMVYVDIITGKQPIEAFDQFVKDWNAQGGQQRSEEANAYYQNIEQISAD